MRKHSWIRVSSIKYGDDYVVNQACAALCRPTADGGSFLINESQLDDCNGALMLLVSSELKDMAKKRGIKQITGKTKEVLCEMITKTAKQRTVTSFFKKKNDDSPNNRLGELNEDVVKITGPMVKLDPVAAELFERIHMIFFRTQSGSGLDNTMKQAVLALIGQIKFPQYTVSRSGDLFASREDVIQFKNLMKVGTEMANFRHAPVKESEQHKKGWELYQAHSGAWSNHIEALGRAASRSATPRAGISGMEYWKRRFTPGYALSRIVEHAAHCAAALKKYEDEEKILRSLLSQQTYRLNKRGEWYERLVILYNNHLRPRASAKDKEAMSQIRQWMQLARDTCIMALNDEHVHRVVIHNLSQQLRKIEAKLGVTEDGQYENDRMCLEWKDAPEHTVYGVRIKDRGRRGPSLWDGDDGIPCSVETLALWRYKENGYVGMHLENALVTTLFTLLFWDVIFSPIPGVLDTEYQSCPLDMFAPSFYASRKEAIDRRLDEIASGKFADQLVLSYNSGNGTACVGVSWDITVRNLLTVAECLGGRRLSAICSVLAKEYSVKSSGFPDLCLWKPGTPEIMFAEVKGPNDKLSETQRDWIDILIEIGVDVEVCLVREGDARDFE
ncbi:hypothetical protein GGI15_003334 [Coemansia interrupta]|uniref:Fanconi-associated nuclease n=1 Tax=Coemansia interrupta TaxID=1126814 RepID=A0A9W8H7Z6_9FUNG|nr:hypothetical protein GGI15_003334 [Coemansia interrupta]